MQHHPSKLAGLLKIERQHLLRAGGWITPPGGRERSVERVGGCRSRLHRGCLQYGCGVTRRRWWQFAQAELVETHRAAATTAPSFNNKLERRTAFERTIRRWSPGEHNLAFLDLDLLPFAWERKVTVVDPPDILAACIDELEFQVVHRRVATHVKRELVVGR